MKKCRTCKTEKPAADFGKRKDSKDGLTYLCRTCDNERGRRYRKANQDQVNTRRAESRKKPEEKARRAAYHAEYTRRPEVAAARKERGVAAAGTDRRLESVRRYNNSTKGKNNSVKSKASRRSREHNAPSDDWKASEVHSEANGKCLYCGISVTLNEMHADHFIPLAKGGSNLRENIVCSCASCNLKKSDKMPEDFIGETL